MPPTIITPDKVQAYQIFGHVINFDKRIATIQTAGRNGQKAQYLCELKEGEYLPIEAGDVFYGLARPPDSSGIYQCIASPKVVLSYTDAVMELPFRLSLGIKIGQRTYDKLRVNYKDPKDLSNEMDLYSVQKRPAKPHELSWKQWKKVLGSWRYHRAYRQFRLWGMDEEQIDNFLDLARCTLQEMMGWINENPEAIFTLTDTQILSIRERNNRPQTDADLRMKAVVGEMYADLKQGYLSIPADSDCLEKLSMVEKSFFQKKFPIYVLGSQWYLRYPGIVVEAIRDFLKQAKQRVVRDLPPFVIGEMSLANGRTVRLSHDQVVALTKAVRQVLTIINGAAGTGKTTTLRALYNFCKSYGLSIIVACYTGKASARAREVLSSDEPCTLDLLCQKTTPGTLEVDFLCIDEVSQCSMELFYRVMCLFKRPPQIILIGDPNQLPPIKWGPLLDSLIESGWPVEMLTEIHRHKDNMLVNPHRILQGLPLEINPACVYFPTNGDKAALAQIRAIYQFILSGGNWTPLDITVISPYDYLAADTNKETGNLIFRNNEWFNVGDRIVMKENAYDIELELPEGVMRNPSQDPKLIAKDSVFNGEEGKVTAVTSEHVVCKFGEKSFKFKWETGDSSRRKKWNTGEENTLTTSMILRAYAYTVDRSQGSEWPFVILYFPSTQGAARFVDRRRLYTAITRAKDCVFFVGNIGDYNAASERLFQSKTIPLMEW